MTLSFSVWVRENDDVKDFFLVVGKRERERERARKPPIEKREGCEGLGEEKNTVQDKLGNQKSVSLKKRFFS